MRPTERNTLLAFGLATILVIAVAMLQQPSGEQDDLRLSTLLDGPRGASGLASSVERLGFRVERWRKPLLRLPPPESTVLALLDAGTVEPAESRAIGEWVRDGGTLFVAGYTGFESCFGARLEIIDRAEREQGLEAEPGELRPAGDSVGMPEPRFVIAPAKDTPGARSDTSCTFGPVIGTQLLLTARLALPVAVRYSFARGSVTLVADARYVSNRDLRDTDAGATVIPWLLYSRPARVVFDEYHHGFGGGRTLFSAAWWWVAGSRAAPFAAQLMLALLLLLALSARRFGPALEGLPRRRRSPLEHLEALAVGLRRSKDPRESVRLIVRGLRRRLGGLGRGSDDEWLAALQLAAAGPGARQHHERLARAMAAADQEQAVLGTAQAAEDLWNTLKRTPPNAS